MASIPINPTQLTPPRVPLVDERTGAISREWYRFFLSLLTATQANTDTVDTAPDSESLVASLAQIVATVQNELQTLPNADISSIQNQLNELQDTFGMTPPTLLGSVTSVDASGGSTGLTFTGGPITSSGTLVLGGTLAVANGGTGQTSYTNGQLLIGNTTGNTLTPATLTAGTNVTISNGTGSITINATDAFVGTVTSVSVVSANGFAGTVATATTTPAITMSTTVTGVLKGNGTAISAATAGTDYVAPGAYTTSGLTMATSRLLGRTTASTGAAEEISVAGGLTLSAGVLTGTSGTVTSVAALTLGTTGTDLSSTVANGTTTPVITLQVPTASAANRGALSAADWTTFNNKGSGSVTSVGGTGTVNGITLTGTVTTSGNLTLGGTLSGVSLTSQVTGTLPVGNGGTGTATAFTAGSVVFAGASGVYAQDNANLFWDDTNNGLGIGTTSLNARLSLGSLVSNKVFALYDDGTNQYGMGIASGEYRLFAATSGSVCFGNYARSTDTFTENMRINGSGNVLINETTPSGASLVHNFEVNGDIMSTGSGSGLFWSNRSTAPSSGADWYGWYTTGGTIYLYNPAAGNIASINASTGAYTALSDAAKKKDFEPSTVGLDAVLALKPTLFRMETDADDAPKQLGFIAQDVKDCIPQAYVEQQNTDAGGNDATYIGLNDRPIIAALVKAVQELKAELDALKGRFTV